MEGVTTPGVLQVPLFITYSGCAGGGGGGGLTAPASCTTYLPSCLPWAMAAGVANHGQCGNYFSAVYVFFFIYNIMQRGTTMYKISIKRVKLILSEIMQGNGFRL